MPEFEAILLITAVFLLAGMVKGVVGLGLPTISLGLLTTAFDLITAMTLMVIPSLATNLMQAMVGGNGALLIRRLWPFLTAAGVTVWLGTSALVHGDHALLSILLGLLLVAYSVQGLAGLGISVPERWQPWAGPLFGTANGILTGMTGSFVVPGTLYLQSIGLGRNELVQAMGMLFTVSTISLAFSLQGHGLLDGSLGLTSFVALIPAFVGMMLGQAVRHRLSESRFRTIFFCAILALGLYIVVTGIPELK